MSVMIDNDDVHAVGYGNLDVPAKPGAKLLVRQQNVHLVCVTRSRVVS